MVRYFRTSIQTSDVLDCPDEELRQEYEKPFKSIGLFQTSDASITAHVLHARPLLIGTISTSSEGTFFPQSPGLYNSSALCRQKDYDPSTNYSIYECENLPGAVHHLEVAYPKVNYKENKYTLAVESEKVVTDQTVPGGIVLSKGINGFYQVIGEKGEKISVDRLTHVYDKSVWPYAKTYFRNIRNHYFSYFREYEAKYGLKHSGSGTKDWSVDGDLDKKLPRMRLWKKIKDFFHFT